LKEVWRERRRDGLADLRKYPFQHRLGIGL
jgi:hypothetical protein